MLIKGAALIARDEHALALRFIADVDVLLDLTSWEKAFDIAIQAEWKTEKKLDRETAVYRMRQTHHSLSLLRGRHGAVDLHQFSLRLNRQLGVDAMVWKRAMPGTLGGVSVLLPHPSDQLAIMFGHCFLYSNPPRTDWVTDALATIATLGFDWRLFAQIHNEARAVPAAAGLTYLAEGLQRPIPPDLIESILARVREPFLTEFISSHDSYKPKGEIPSHAIYLAERIRSRLLLKDAPKFPRTPTPESIAKGLTRTAFSDISVDDKVHFELPSNVEIFDRMQFRLRSSSPVFRPDGPFAYGCCVSMTFRSR